MKRRAIAAAFPHTLPIFAGYAFLGMSYGVLITSHGFPFWFPILTSVAIYAGSMEFVTVNLLLGTFNPVQAFLMTLMINARHLFYGLSMLDPYRGMGWKRPHLIFGLTDETFSVNCAAEPPEGVDRGWFYLFVTLLDHSYWILGAALGGVFGSLLRFNTEGLDFVMTAMFVVILLEHFLKEKDRRPALLGLALPAASLLLLGPERFMIPAMAAVLLALTLLRKPLERGMEP